MNQRRQRHAPLQSRGIRFLLSVGLVVAVLIVSRAEGASEASQTPHSAPRAASLPADPHRQFLYAAEGGGTGVSVFAIASDGSLEGEIGPFAADAGPDAVRVGPNGRFLYVVNSGQRSRRHHYGDLSVFSIGPDGLLTELARSPYPIGGTPDSLVLSSDGTHLFTVNRYGVWAYSVRANGSLERVARSPVPLPGGAPVGSLALTPDGKELYAATFGRAAQIAAFAVGPRGGLTALPGSPFADNGSNPGPLVTTPDGKELYVGNSGGIGAYSIRPDGALRVIATFARGVDAGALAVGPRGRYLYVSDAQSGRVSVYWIGARGHLSRLGSPVSIGSGSVPEGLAVSASGTELYVADSGSNAISAFRVGLDGSLLQVAGSPFAAPRGPDALAIATLVSGAPAASTPVESPPAASCRKDPLAGVYHPWRLRINQPCITVSGIVERVKTEPDHDWHVNLLLPPASRHLVNAENRKHEHGELVVEVIPMDQRDIPRPTVGEHVTVTGAYVLDTDHGWEEVHPAWSINGRGSVRYSAEEAKSSVETGIRGNEQYFGRRRHG